MEINLLIVVNMFLTGFDNTTLNTLLVDKNLRTQYLLQVYSRTNKILNSIKTFYKYYKYEYEDTNGKKVRQYTEPIEELQEKYPVGSIIENKKEQKQFTKIYGAKVRVLEKIKVFFDRFKNVVSSIAL